MLNEESQMSVLQDKLLVIDERFEKCQQDFARMNDTILERVEIIQNLKERLETLETRCHGKNGLHAGLCSGHGSCVDRDNCECVQGWTGYECQWREWELIEVDQAGPTKRNTMASAVVQDRLWIHGGWKMDSALTDELWSFSPMNAEWINVTFAGTRPTPRSSHSAVVYDNVIWVYGGVSIFPGTTYHHEIWKFHVESTSWVSVLANEHEPRRMLHSAVVYEDSMWVFGGGNASGRKNTTMSFHFPSSSWDIHPGQSPSRRQDHTGVVYEDCMWIFGWWRDSGGFLEVQHF